MKSIFILIGCLLIVGCNDSAYVLPEDFENADIACANHNKWLFFEKSPHTAHKATIDVKCVDGVSISYTPKQD